MRCGGVGLVVLSTALQLAGQTGGDGVVSGTVVNAATGEPLGGALVVLRVSYANYGFRDRPGDRPWPADVARALTDESGRFAIEFDRSVPASRLFVSRDGFRSEDNREIVIVPLLPMGAQNVTISLVPQSVIRGRVMDEQGAPLSGAAVRAIRVEIQDGREQLRPNYSVAVAGPSGEYRLATLAPGSYYLEASRVGADVRHGFGPVYFSGVTERHSAQTLQTRAGETITADFELSPHPLYQIRGVLSNVQPLRHVALRLLQDGEPLNNPTVVTAGNKSFEIENVAPGSYVVQAFTPEAIPVDFGEAAVTVSDRDPAPVQIALSEAVDVRGRIELDGVKRPLRLVYVVATPLSSFPPLRISPSSRAMMIGDGSFLLRNLLPGRYELAVRMLPGAYVESMTASSPGTATEDVQQRGFTIGAGHTPDLKIVLHRGGGEIEGAVEGASLNASVPVVVARREVPERFVALVSAQQGRFLASGLAPGEYDLYALPPSVPVEYKNPEVLEALSEFAAHAVVRDGLKEFVKLRLIPADAATHPIHDSARAMK
jgi:hypothetical protein